MWNKCEPLGRYRRPEKKRNVVAFSVRACCRISTTLPGTGPLFFLFFYWRIFYNNTSFPVQCVCSAVQCLEKVLHRLEWKRIVIALRGDAIIYIYIACRLLRNTYDVVYHASDWKSAPTHDFIFYSKLLRPGGGDGNVVEQWLLFQGRGWCLDKKKNKKKKCRTCLIIILGGGSCFPDFRTRTFKRVLYGF